MTYKLTCPNCDCHTSAIFGAYEDGKPCPYCGASLAVSALEGTIVELKDRPGELARIMHYGVCYEDVTRGGESQPCGKIAVAIRIDPRDDGPYPVCAYHTRGDMVSLSDILDRLT